MPGRVKAMDSGTVGGINVHSVLREQRLKQFLHQVMDNKRKRQTKRAVSNW